MMVKVLVIFLFLIFSTIIPTFGSLDKDFDTDLNPDGYLYVDDVSNPNEEDLGRDVEQVHSRWKRDTSYDGDIVPEAPSLAKKLQTLAKSTPNIPPAILSAIKFGNFSNVTSQDLRSVNITILEYIPPQMLSKLNSSEIETIIARFIDFDRPNAMGRIVGLGLRKLNPLGMIHRLSGQKIYNNEAASVLLYSVIQNLTAQGHLTARNIDMMDRTDLGLLKYVSKEQLMKVKDPQAAGKLLQKLYPTAQPSHIDTTYYDIDDFALVNHLLTTQYGPPTTWSNGTFQNLISQYLPFMTTATLSKMNPKYLRMKQWNFRTAIEQIFKIKSIQNPFQGKNLTDVFMENVKITEENVTPLGTLAAFVDITDNITDKEVLKFVVSTCEKWKIPVGIGLVKGYLRAVYDGRSLNNLHKHDLSRLDDEIYRNGPPSLISKAIQTQAIDKTKLLKIIGGNDNFPESKNLSRGMFGSEWIKGMVSQLSFYALTYYKEGGDSFNMLEMPPLLYGSTGTTSIQNLDFHDISKVLVNLKQMPDSMTDVQKQYFLRKLQDHEVRDQKDLPPEFGYVRSRKINQEVKLDDIIGLPSDSEYRLAFGSSKRITTAELESNPYLVGTLTPRKIDEIEIEQIPGVLAAVRKSKDGPQSAALKALSLRLIQYIQLKSDDNSSPPKSLLKYVTAAEVSKYPASVLAYFIDGEITSKLPALVRKEILIALGELSVKDRKLIPEGTREEIVAIGLKAIEEMAEQGLPGTPSRKVEKLYNLTTLAAIGKSVEDLQPNHIGKLEPAALELALGILQGTSGESTEIKVRACLNEKQKLAWRDGIVKNYGPPQLWSPTKTLTLCCLLPFLTERDLISVNSESLVRCSCISDSNPPSHFIELKFALDKACERKLGKPDTTLSTFNRIKSERAIDVAEKFETNLNMHNGQHKHQINCFALRLAGSAVYFDLKNIKNHSNLNTLNPEEMKSCLYELGRVKLSGETTKLLWDKLLSIYGGRINSIPVEYLRQANYLLTAIRSEDDITNFNFSNYDVVGALGGRNLGFSKVMLTYMANHFQKTWSAKKGIMESYSSFDLISLKNILCGFKTEQLSRIVPEAFSDALPILRTIDPNCELTKLQTLVGVATHSNVYGPVSGWTAADVRGVGTLLKGLTTTANQIPPEAFLGLTPSVAESLGNELLQSLTVAQLENWPRFAAEALNREQLDSLSWAGREVMEGVRKGPFVTGSSLGKYNFINRMLMTIFVLVAMSGV